ncbi:hypothetical protein HK104_000319 [Borealophlyctis nickersoniae]|nr:hypothetical protein HK104_000319 [Borealophlyctis nickersoniae]
MRYHTIGVRTSIQNRKELFKFTTTHDLLYQLEGRFGRVVHKTTAINIGSLYYDPNILFEPNDLLQRYCETMEDIIKVWGNEERFKMYVASGGDMAQAVE